MECLLLLTLKGNERQCTSLCFFLGAAANGSPTQIQNPGTAPTCIMYP
jgi:hypothetical protein